VCAHVTVTAPPLHVAVGSLSIKPDLKRQGKQICGSAVIAEKGVRRL
jgi:hypothetical protein